MSSADGREAGLEHSFAYLSEEDGRRQIDRFSLPSAGECETLIKQAETREAQILLRQYHWPDMHEGTFESPTTFIILTDIEGSGTYGSADNEFKPLGNVRFFPGGVPFYSQWRADGQRALFVAVDMNALTNNHLDLDEKRLVECGDLRNHYVQSLLVRMQCELEQPGFATQLVLESASFAIAAELLQHFSGRRGTIRVRGDKLGLDDVRRIAVRFREEGQLISLEELAIEEGVSARQFARLFKSATGVNIGTFGARQVILRSKDLLSNRQLLVKEVAIRCGYANTTSFCRAFSRMEGYTPQEFRKRIGMKEE